MISGHSDQNTLGRTWYIRTVEPRQLESVGNEKKKFELPKIRVIEKIVFTYFIRQDKDFNFDFVHLLTLS